MIPTPLRRRLLGALVATQLLLITAAEPAGDRDESGDATAADVAPEDAGGEEPEWDVQSPPGEPRTVAIDVREGTWMSVDVHPDGDEIVFDLLGDVYAIPFEGGEARALTDGIAWEYQPGYSPDGEQVAFTSDAGGGDNVWIMGRDGSDPRAVTEEDFRLLNSPAWSPDGRYLAARKHFTHRRSAGAGEIWLYHASGGGGLQLTERANEQKDVGEPAFSPDGRYVYFSYDATPGATFQYGKDPNPGIYAIDRLDRETGERVQVAGGPGGACRPTPSPDGRSLAFVRRVRYQSTLFVMDLASGRARPVHAPLERDMQETWAIHGVYPTMAWTPDSRQLVFWARGKLWRVDVESGEAEEIPFHVAAERELREPVRSPGEAAPDEFEVKVLRSVCVSPTGEHVAYTALGHVWVRPLPDGEPRRLTRQSDHFEFFPAFSRDGERIVYVSWDDEELGAVRVASVRGPAEPGPALTPEPGHYAHPTFTPDGTQVVYEKRAGGYVTSPLWSRDPGVYRVPAAGGAAPELVVDHGGRPQFGADGERVFLMQVEQQEQADRRALFSVELDGSDERTHLVSENATAFAVSPDGEWVAFTERFQAYVAPFVPTGREVSIGPKTEAFPVTRVSRDAGENLQWSGDSARLYWSLGPELFERPLSDAFAFVDGAPEELPEPPASGRNVSFRVAHDRPDGVLALLGARLVTLRGDEVIEDGALVVDGNRIVAVGPADAVEVPRDAVRVDVAGTTIVPGLIDVHAHGPHGAGGITPEQNWSHYANLAFGVTTTHDPSHDTNTIFAASELARAGAIVAPRIFSTGTILYGALAPFKAEIDTLDDALSHLRRLRAVGAFSVKSYNQPRRDQRQMVLEAARRTGMMVVPEGGSDHQHNLTMVVDGHTGLEHQLPLERVYADVTQLWGPSGVGYTPTLICGYGGIWGEDYWYERDDVWEHERLMTFVPRFVVDPRSRRRTKSPAVEYNTLRSAGIAKALVDAGARVQLGAHGQLQGLGAHWELWMLGLGGLTPLEALRAATLDGAYYIGLDRDLGSLEPGKLADLLVLEANPLEDLRASQEIRYTMLNGRLFDARTMAPLHGPGRGTPPRFFWQDLQEGLPAHQVRLGGCASCAFE